MKMCRKLYLQVQQKEGGGGKWRMVIWRTSGGVCGEWQRRFFTLMHVCVMLWAAKWMQQMDVQTGRGGEKKAPVSPSNSSR